MPIYDVRCNVCGTVKEVIIQPGQTKMCCNQEVEILPTYFIGMTKWKGEGGFPSRRNQFNDKKHLMSRKQVPYLSQANPGEGT